MIKVGLFVPCYVNQFYPAVGIATLQLLEKLEVAVQYPQDQTCCGQPMANAGFEHQSAGCKTNFIRCFTNMDYIVCPSGSCTLFVKEHVYDDMTEAPPIFELTEFLTDVLKITSLQARFPFRVGLHQSCHGQRGLKLSQMSELVAPPFSKPASLLRMVDKLELTPLSRVDECCGFGGTFCITEEAVSVRMGTDRIGDHASHGAEFITAADMSCLMHLEGILKRQKSAIRVKHIAEILNSDH